MNLTKVDQALESIVYVAVRVTDGEQWIDTTTVSIDHSVCENKVKNTATYIPQWGKMNKVIAIVRCTVTLCKDAI